MHSSSNVRGFVPEDGHVACRVTIVEIMDEMAVAYKTLGDFYGIRIERTTCFRKDVKGGTVDDSHIIGLLPHRLSGFGSACFPVKNVR